MTTLHTCQLVGCFSDSLLYAGLDWVTQNGLMQAERLQMNLTSGDFHTRWVHVLGLDSHHQFEVTRPLARTIIGQRKRMTSAVDP